MAEPSPVEVLVNGWDGNNALPLVTLFVATVEESLDVDQYSLGEPVVFWAQAGETSWGVAGTWEFRSSTRVEVSRPPGAFLWCSVRGANLVRCGWDLLIWVRSNAFWLPRAHSGAEGEVCSGQVPLPVVCLADPWWKPGTSCGWSEHFLPTWSSSPVGLVF